MTAIPTGRSNKDGAERDCLGSPLAPFTPDEPVSPDVPFYSFRPLSPCLPGGPFGGPFGPGFPGGPGFPRVSILPRKATPVTFWSWAAECVILSKELVLEQTKFFFDKHL